MMIPCAECAQRAVVWQRFARDVVDYPFCSAHRLRRDDPDLEVEADIAPDSGVAFDLSHAPIST